MDDPWGSPWADEIQHPVTTTKKKDNGKVSPKTPAKASTLRLEVKTNSPWDDDEDDGFGEWAAVPTGDGVGSNGLGFDGASDSWETRDIGDDRGEVKREFNGLDLSWNDNTPVPDNGIAKLASSLMPKSAKIVREPSPDPWATETILNDERLKEDTVQPVINDHGLADARGGLIGDVDNGVAEEAGTPEESPPKDAETTFENGTTDESDLPTITDEQEPLPEAIEVIPVTKKTEEVDFVKSGPDEKDLAQQPPQDSEEVNGHETGHESSRPSSSPSDQSHHDEILSESPRTSLDEEPKRSQAPRQVSSKIQELVEHFDGLAKLEEEALIEPNPSRSRSKTPSAETEKILAEPEELGQEDEKVEEEEDDDDEEDDFGDFEDGHSEVEESMEEAEVARPVTPTPNPSHIASSPASKTASPQSQVSPPRSRYVMKDYGRVEFDVNASTLSKINSPPGNEGAEEAPMEEVFIMDAIPFDSFTSMEERKTWYRISRYGSMRKHNSGDDENYVRVNWAQSQIREQTLKTVGRWMEEDRISGRVVLGSGSKGSSIFGWNDPNAPVVPLDSVFAAKRGKKTSPAPTSVEAVPEVPREWPKGLVRDRSTSKSQSPSKSQRRISSKSSSISEVQKTNLQVPVANFGWNASPATNSQSPIPLASETPKGVPTTMKPTLPPPQSRSLNPQPTTPTTFTSITPMEAQQPQKPADVDRPTSLLRSKPIVPVLPPPLKTTSNNDEDDWGEMQSSPVVTTPPVLPPTQSLQHKKSQSLSGAFSPASQKSSIDSPAVLPQPGQDHTPVVSFDEILVPKLRNSLDSKSDPLPSPVFPTTSPSSFFDPVIQPSPASAAVTSATSNSDPWASADFSFFDSPAPAPAPVPKSTPVPATKPALRPAPPKAVSFAKTPPAPSPLRHGKTRQEIEQDEIVAAIVKSLPDLSYMMRR